MEEVGQAARHLLNKDNCGIALSNDAEEVGDEVAGVVSSAPLAGDGEGLAGRAAEDEVDPASPGGAVEGAEVGPDRGTIQPSVLSSPKEHVLTERVDFAVGERLVAFAEREVDPEVERADTGREGEAMDHRLLIIAPHRRRRSAPALP